MSLLTQSKDDQKSINFLSKVRFLHEVAENFELITEGLKNAGFQDDKLNKFLDVTNLVITQINNGLLLYVGWTAGRWNMNHIADII